jgi:hypothetical protein
MEITNVRCSIVRMEAVIRQVSGCIHLRVSRIFSNRTTGSLVTATRVDNATMLDTDALLSC